MADLSGNVPQVIALIDLSDLQWQTKQIGGSFGHDVTAVLEQLEAGVAKLGPAPEGRLPLGVVHVYLPLEADRPREAKLVVFRLRPTEVKRKCWGCYEACTHCQGGTVDPGGRGRLLSLLLTPVVRYLRSYGRKIIHGCFPPVATDLTEECWASIDPCPLSRGLD